MHFSRITVCFKTTKSLDSESTEISVTHLRKQMMPVHKTARHTVSVNPPTPTIVKTKTT